MSINRFNPDIAPEVGPQTYAETQGQPPFDWNAFLRNPPATDSTEHLAAAMRAQCWTTCATGNQCSVIPRYGDNEDSKHPAGCPKDSRLADLGGKFYGDVMFAKWDRARETLWAIEARSAELIAELSPQLAAR